MAEKKKASKTGKNSMSWEDVGRFIGEKFEKSDWESKCRTWSWNSKHNDSCGGFLGRLLFIIGVMILMSHWGLLDGISIWVRILLVAGFALMKL